MITISSDVLRGKSETDLATHDLLITSNASGAYCDRSLAGRNGVVFSYNFPLDYDRGLNCLYIHYFPEFEKGEVKEICLQFKR